MSTRIVSDPQVHFGKPCIASTRIPVQCVLELVRDGYGIETIRGDYYPDLSTEDVQACVQYAIDLIDRDDHQRASVA